MFSRNPAFLGQLRLMPPTFPPYMPGAAAMMNSEEELQRRLLEQLNARSGAIVETTAHYPPMVPGATPGPVGNPQITDIVETPPQSITDIGPTEEPPPVQSTDELFPHRTSMAPEGEGGCPPGQYRPTWSVRCVPKGGGGIDYGGIASMAPTAAVPFTMGRRSMLGRVPLRPTLGQFDVPVDCGYWKRKMDEYAKDIAFAQQSIQRRANSPYREDLVNDPYTQMKFEEARKKYDDAYRMYNACLKYDKAYWEGTPIQQPVTPPPVETGAPQGVDYPPPPPPVPSEDVRPMVPSVDTRMQPDWSRVPTDVVGPEEQPTEPPFGQEMPLPGFAQAQGLPCPEGQHRPPGGGWCVPDESPVATGYSPANALQRFGGYGGIINMAPSGGVPFTMGHPPRKEAAMHGPFLGQVPLVPAGAACPPGRVLYNVGGRLLCVPRGQFPPAEYSGARPIGAFGGFGMAPSAPIGTAGMGPSSVPITMGGRAMLGQVRLVKRPY